MIRAAFLVALAISLSGCAATEVRAKLDYDPLPLIKNYVTTEASDKWRVYDRGDDRIEIVDTWPTYSVFTLSYTAMHGDLRYRDGEFLGAFYLKTVALGNFFIPAYVDMSASFFGWSVKPYMRIKMAEVLRAGKISRKKRIITHSHDLSEYD